MNAETDVSLTLERDFVRMLPAQAAAELELLSADEAAQILLRNTGPATSPVWERLSPAVAQRCLSELAVADAAAVMGVIDPSRAATILGGLDEDARRQILARDCR